MSLAWLLVVGVSFLLLLALFALLPEEMRCASSGTLYQWDSAKRSMVKVVAG